MDREYTVNELIGIHEVVKVLGLRNLNHAHYLLRARAFRPYRQFGRTFMFIAEQVKRQFAEYQAAHPDSRAAAV
jgi:hypothetical protein